MALRGWALSHADVARPGHRAAHVGVEHAGPRLAGGGDEALGIAPPEVPLGEAWRHRR